MLGPEDECEHFSELARDAHSLVRVAVASSCLLRGTIRHGSVRDGQGLEEA